MKKGERGGAKMKVTVMTNAKVKERIDRIQRAGIAVTGDGLRMAIAQNLGDQNEAEGEADNDYLPAEPRLAEAPRQRLQHSSAVHRSGSFPNRVSHNG